MSAINWTPIERLDTVTPNYPAENTINYMIRFPANQSSEVYLKDGSYEHILGPQLGWYKPGTARYKPGYEYMKLADMNAALAGQMPPPPADDPELPRLRARSKRLDQATELIALMYGKIQYYEGHPPE